MKMLFISLLLTISSGYTTLTTCDFILVEENIIYQELMDSNYDIDLLYWEVLLE